MGTEKRSEAEIYIFLAISLDGFIARNNGEIDWLEKFNSDDPNEDYGFDEFFKRMDCLIMGRKSFEKVLSFEKWPYTGKPVQVLSRTLTSLPVTVSGLAELDTKTDSSRAFGLLEGIRMAAYLLGWRRSSKIVSRVRFGKTTYSNTHSHHFRYWQTAIWKYASRNLPKSPPYQEFCFRISTIGL